jgi:hypothetical protein
MRIAPCAAVFISLLLLLQNILPGKSESSPWTMEYCSLQDAFPEVGGGPANPGCKGPQAGEVARKEERKKAKRCKGPPLTFLDPPGDAPLVDPDRPALRPMPEVPPLNTATGLREHAPVDAPQMEPFQDMNGTPRPRSEIMASFRSEQPPADEGILNTLPKGLAGPNAMQKPTLPSYFGKNFDDSVEEGFASFTNVIGDDPGYMLSPDFTSAFAGKGVEKASGSEVLPVPSVRNVWKPLTPSGARTAFFDELPLPGGIVSVDQAKQAPPYDKEEFFKKLDSIYARLDDLESRRGENTQTEILLFITSGIFVLFSLDLLVRKTGNVRILNRK